MTSDSLSNQESKKRILVVDNETDMTTILKMALERIGFTVDTFNDPMLALDNFKPNRYTLAILDVMMPKMDGFELYTQLKKRDDETKFCFLTASSEPYLEILKKEKQCKINRDLFLEIPLPIKEIIGEIRKRIGSE